jgi:hypothetical protein
MATQDEALQKGEQFLNDVVAGKYQDAQKTFDHAMSEMMPVEGLQAAWEQIQVQAGKYKERVSSKVVTQDGHNIVMLTLRFERGQLVNRLIYDDKNQLAGMHFTPKE